jgi:putative hydrolase of the HAD superfamily
VTTWVFDLDNTLYPPSANLFGQIEVKMTDWMMRVLDVEHAEANRLRAQYWESYGTTLAGLMEVHGMAPDAYLQEVHDVSFDGLEADAVLAERIAALPGRRIVYTNATEPYARNVLAARGLSDVFDAVYGVEHAGFQPKPRRAAFEAVFAADGLDPAKGAMFEDDPRNLAVPHEMGMQTVFVAPAPLDAPHIHHHTADLSDFLSQFGGLAAARGRTTS